MRVLRVPILFLRKGEGNVGSRCSRAGCGPSFLRLRTPPQIQGPFSASVIFAIDGVFRSPPQRCGFDIMYLKIHDNRPASSQGEKSEGKTSGVGHADQPISGIDAPYRTAGLHRHKWYL